MITNLRIQNFKSWKDTGQVRIGALTGLFGTNSSGKTAILQMLLLMKQIVESNNRLQVFNTDGENAHINIGTFSDAIHHYQIPGEISFSVDWNLLRPTPLVIAKLEDDLDTISYVDLEVKELHFKNTIEGTQRKVALKEFYYGFRSNENNYLFGLRNPNSSELNTSPNYELISKGYELEPYRNRVNGKYISKSPDELNLSQPVKSYGFPDGISSTYQSSSFLSTLVLEFERLFRNMYYLGPLREYPLQYYAWSGERTQDVGQRGERAIPALLGAEPEVTSAVAEWLKKLGLIHNFKLQQTNNKRNYEVIVQTQPNAPEVLITSVGFGISQVLPILVLCFYVPEGATILLEQPELHLHPAVQAGLADLFIEVIQKRNLQIILESHSEHLLRRLQRRVAEKKLSNEQAALYFCHNNNEGESEITGLEMDEAGNISNWPENFFGDELGDLIAMTLAGAEA